MRPAQTETDEAILDELGSRIARLRIERNWTQAELATESGVSKRTIERMEQGTSIQLSSLIRICRSLELLEGLNNWIPDAKPGPVEQLRSAGKKRKRASRKNDARRASRKSAKQPDGNWTWGDDNSAADN